MKTVYEILGEAAFVGVFLVVFYFIVHWIRLNFIKVNCPEPMCLYLELIAAGALFHIVCEYTGINKWYSINYVNKLNSSKVN